jgi:hypothetical protein
VARSRLRHTSDQVDVATSLPNSGSPVGEFYAATITPDYESGGQEFESLLSRHLSFQINGLRGRLGATIGAANWWRI